MMNCYWWKPRNISCRLSLRLWCWEPECGRLKWSWRFIYCPRCRAKFRAEQRSMLAETRFQGGTVDAR